jgi:hypothetical protein
MGSGRWSKHLNMQLPELVNRILNEYCDGFSWEAVADTHSIRYKSINKRNTKRRDGVYMQCLLQIELTSSASCPVCPACKKCIHASENIVLSHNYGHKQDDNKLFNNRGLRKENHLFSLIHEKCTEDCTHFTTTILKPCGKNCFQKRKSTN